MVYSSIPSEKEELVPWQILGRMGSPWPAFATLDDMTDFIAITEI